MNTKCKLLHSNFTYVLQGAFESPTLDSEFVHLGPATKARFSGKSNNVSFIINRIAICILGLAWPIDKFCWCFRNYVKPFVNNKVVKPCNSTNHFTSLFHRKRDSSIEDPPLCLHHSKRHFNSNAALTTIVVKVVVQSLPSVLSIVQRYEFLSCPVRGVADNNIGLGQVVDQIDK